MRLDGNPSNQQNVNLATIDGSEQLRNAASFDDNFLVGDFGMYRLLAEYLRQTKKGSSAEFVGEKL